MLEPVKDCADASEGQSEESWWHTTFNNHKPHVLPCGWFLRIDTIPASRIEGQTAFWLAEVTVVRTKIKSACLKLCRDWKYRVNQDLPRADEVVST